MRQAAEWSQHPTALYEWIRHSAQQYILHHRLIIPVPRPVCKGGRIGFMSVRSHNLMRC